MSVDSFPEFKIESTRALVFLFDRHFKSKQTPTFYLKELKEININYIKVHETCFLLVFTFCCFQRLQKACRATSRYPK